jgi:hypothetical protein
MAAARRQAAVLVLVLALVMGAGLAPGPRGCAAQGEAVVVSSYGQGRLSLKPYDWTYLRGETVSGFYNLGFGFLTFSFFGKVSSMLYLLFGVGGC